MTLTATLARFASQLNISDVPAEIRTKVNLHVLDAIACGWAASRTAMGESARQLARAGGGRGEALIFGGAGDYSPLTAAFANAFIINGLDHDDCVEINGKGMGHPGASLIAAAMAALDARPEGISAADLQAALIAGFEVNNRLISALQPSAESYQKAYGVSQHQAVPAAVVYARACGFDESTTHSALGFAATLTCVPSLHKYNWKDRPIAALKDGVAPAAQAAVQAALMAEAGMAGSQDVLDGPQGYWRMVGTDRFDATSLIRGLGQDWFARFGSFKRYPACRWLATALECAEDLMERSGWNAEDIKRIEVRTFSRLAEDFMVYAPLTPTDAQFSLPYTLAVTVLRIPINEWYDEANLKSLEVHRMASKVAASVDAELDALWTSAARQPGASVTLLDQAERQLWTARATPYGSATRPMKDSEVLDKALRNIQNTVVQPVSLVTTLLENTDCVYHGSASWIGSPPSD